VAAEDEDPTAAAPGAAPAPDRPSGASLERALRGRVALTLGRSLRQLEVALAGAIDSPVALVREMGHYSAGGKRLRPMLLMLAARVAGYRGRRAVDLGCVVELLHTATLIHDDVVDHAALRRGRASANARWGEDASILFGDYLYAKSLALLLQDGDPKIMQVLSDVTVAMTEAELLQLEQKRGAMPGEDVYLRIVAQKTAAFMSACCRIGALLGNCTGERLTGLTQYGRELGIAFQLCDDALDYAVDATRLGKPVGADLADGKQTLPLLLALDRADAAERARMQALLRTVPVAPAALDELRATVVRLGGVETALARAENHARSAKAALSWFDDSAEREMLFMVADFAVRRDH
jgi:octaprenyl-diphosphate synthase